MKLKNIKVLAVSLVALGAAGALASCGSETGTTIVVWAPTEEQAVIDEVVKEYNKTAEYKINYKFTAVSEADGGTTLGNDPQVKNAPALVAAADDHIFGLAQKKIAQKLPTAWKNFVLESNTEVAIKGASYNGDVYGFPISTDNGYFLYYNKEVIKDTDKGTLEGILAACKAANKKFRMDLANGWYVNSIPQAQGITGTESLSFTADADGIAIYNIGWDTEISAKAFKAVNELINVTYKDTLIMGADDVMTGGFQDESVVAGVSGTWMQPALEKAIGKENLGACKLPTFNVEGTAHQMASFTGTKVYVINKYRPSEEQRMAADLGKLLTSKEAQLVRFRLRNSLPCNKEALLDPAYTENISLGGAALVEQNQFAAVQSQSAEGRYWDVGKAMGQAIYDGKLAEGESAGTTHTVAQWKAFLETQCNSLRKSGK